jgi:hypothetical protein
MDVHPGRRIVAGALADPDAGHLDDDHDHLARFRELVHGFPWAWDEEVVADEARLPEHQSARLAAACLVAGDARVKAVLRRDVPQAVDPEHAWSDALDAKVVVRQGAARWEQRAWQGQRDVPPLVLQARP